MLKQTCKFYMEQMQELCSKIGVPLSDKKTEGPTQLITFLRLCIDFLNQVVTIPKEKVDNAVQFIKDALSTLNTKDKNKHGKVLVKTVQRITGTLNFLCRAVPCGHPLLRRMYNL